MYVALVNVMRMPLTLAKLTEIHQNSSSEKVTLLFTMLIRAHRYVEAHSLMMISQGAKVQLDGPVIVDIVRGIDPSRPVEHDYMVAEPSVMPFALMDYARRWLINRLDAIGASVETCDENGMSPLMWAIKLCDVAMACHLAGMLGASLDTLTPGGVSLLAYAVMLKQPYMVAELIRMGADAHWVHPVTGLTLLHYAAYNTVNTDVMRELCGDNNNISIDAESVDGLTPLMVAVLADREYHIIEFLINRGATIRPVGDRVLVHSDFCTDEL